MFIGDSGKMFWEIYAVSMACVVLYVPFKSAIDPFVKNLFDRISGGSKNGKTK